MSQTQGGSQPSAPSEPSDGGDIRKCSTEAEIAALEEKLQVLEAAWETNYFISQGRAIRRIVTLFDSIEDLITENDRRYDVADDDESGSIAHGIHHPYQHPPMVSAKVFNMEYEEYVQMLKKGADSARGDDTSKLKSLVPDWVNREFKPNPPVDYEDNIRAGIRDRADGCIVTEMSWPTFLYEKYTADQDNLKEGFFKSTLLIQAFKSIFTSPSSAKEIDGEGTKVKTHVAQIIKMHKVSPLNRICGLPITIRTFFGDFMAFIDGDFDYVQFWHIIVDFFEKAPGRAAQRKLTASLRGGQGRSSEQVVARNSVMQPSPACP
ncbi:hypothetical protein EV424DRAFT_1543895 [Suillus variegatus]|nr:hypothetical protein EV424DRAFT_1543895 [Suillus variegatus]